MTLPTPAAAGAFLLKNWLPALLVALLAIQTVRIEGFGVWPVKIHGLQDKYDTAIRKLVDARRELKAISDAKNRQAEETKRSIGKAEEREKQARPIADKIRSAPIPPNCATPGIEILRNEI